MISPEAMYCLLKSKMTDELSRFLKNFPSLKVFFFILSIFIAYTYLLTINDFLDITQETLLVPPNKNLFAKMSSALISIKDFKIEMLPAVLSVLASSISFWINTLIYRAVVMLSSPALSQLSKSFHKKIILANGIADTSAKRWNEIHNRNTLATAFYCCALLYTLLTLSIIDTIFFTTSMRIPMLITLTIALTFIYIFIIIIRYVLPSSILRLKKPLTHQQVYTLLRDINS